MELSQLAELRSKMAPSRTDAGDAISAIVVAVHMITEFTKLKTGKPGSFARKIVLLTDGQGMIEDAGMEQIAAKINEWGISLVVLSDISHTKKNVRFADGNTVELTSMTMTLDSKKRTSLY